MKWIVVTIALAAVSCGPGNQSNKPSAEGQITFAMGSCNRQDQPQPMWEEILQENPDVWIWLGDNIYADTLDPLAFQAMYQQQSNNPGYSQLVETADVIGTWDDHDFGINNAGKGNPVKHEAQEAFLDFLGVPKDDPRRERKGVYSSHDYQLNEKLIKVILLDSRYHRDTVIEQNGVHLPNDSGTILGEQQWEWLEKTLKNSRADLHVIGNGIQVLSAEHRFEKWANFPAERKRLLQMVADLDVPGVIFLSGDRHIAEVSELRYEGVPYPLRDITVSGLTHSYSEAGGERNRLRVSPLIASKNYGVLDVLAYKDKLKVRLEIAGLNDTTFYSQEWIY